MADDDELNELNNVEPNNNNDDDLVEIEKQDSAEQSSVQQQQQPKDSRKKGSVKEIEPNTFSLSKLYGSYDLWKNEFSGQPDDVVVLFEAKAENDITIILALGKEDYTLPVYEIVLGGWRNTKSVIRSELQGIERCVSLIPDICSPDEYLSYWVGLKNGQIAVGTGDKPGFNQIICWTNPQHDVDDAQPCYVSFSSWNSTVFIRNVRVMTSGYFDYDWVSNLGSPTEWITNYMPSYIHFLEEDRKQNIARAERFGVAYVPPDPIVAMNRLPHIEREKMKATARIGRVQNSILGSSPSIISSNNKEVEKETEEEILKKKEARAARFGIVASTPPATSSNPVTLDQQISRANRFGIPLTELSKIAEISKSTPLPRREVEENETVRPECIYIYGNLSGIRSGHIYQVFQEYTPSHIEWLNDHSCNIVFPNVELCEKVKNQMVRDIPALGSSEPDDIQQEIISLTQNSWKYLRLDDKQGHIKLVLTRPATLSDVKTTTSRESGRQRRYSDRKTSRLPFNPPKEQMAATTSLTEDTQDETQVKRGRIVEEE